MKNLEIIIDWFEFTIQQSDIDEVCKVLFNVDYKDLVHTPSGRFGYNNTVTYGSKIHIMWHSSRYEMGVHVLLSGSACRELEDLLDWSIFMNRIFSFEVFKFTRVDIAMDCFKQYFTIAKLRKHIKSGYLISRFRKSTYIEQLDIKSGSKESQSLKFGSMSSDIYIVIYDKLSERKNAGYDVDDSIKFWTRVEIRFKHDLAVSFIKSYAQYDFVLGSYINSILYNYLDFKENTGLSRVNNENTASFWLDFLGDVEKLSIAPKATQSDIQRKKSYAQHNLSKLMLMIRATDNDFFDDLLLKGYEKIDKTDLDIINAHMIATNQKILTFDDVYKASLNPFVEKDKSE